MRHERKSGRGFWESFLILKNEETGRASTCSPLDITTSSHDVGMEAGTCYQPEEEVNAKHGTAEEKKNQNP